MFVFPTHRSLLDADVYIIARSMFRDTYLI